MSFGPLRFFSLLELDAGGGDLPSQCGEFELVLAQQGEVPVIGRAQALQQGDDGVVTGILFATLYAGNGRGVTDALTELRLGQSQSRSSLLNVITQRDQIHQYFLHLCHILLGIR